MLKIGFNEYKKLRAMSYNKFNQWLNAFYKAAYEDGRNELKENEMDLNLVGIAIQATEGVSKELHAEIMSTIKKLCFGDMEGEKDGES